MCLSPLRIKDNSVYRSQYLTSPFREVPCGHCAECASVYMKEWQTRICFELDSLYKRGGVACFLTFTYDDAHLPFYNDDSAGIHVRCFNHDDVLTFLNRLKIQVYRKFGRGCYKYFFVSEYGKDTRRPHYHCLFSWSLLFQTVIGLLRSAANFGALPNTVITALCSRNTLKLNIAMSIPSMNVMTPLSVLC